MKTRIPCALAVLGSTGTGKSILGLTLAKRYGGEIVSCDSTAVYRGFDIGTDKLPSELRQGIPHHLIDVVDPTDQYSVARYASDAAKTFLAIRKRGRLPILVGGTGLYYRGLVRGMFSGPARAPQLRARLSRIAANRGVATLYRMVEKVDPISAERIQPNDLRRLIRAIEVYRLTGRSLTSHFSETRSLIEGWNVISIAITLPRVDLIKRLTRRVEAQFEGGLLDEINGLLSSGVPASAPPFGGLVYRQALEHIAGVRNEIDTRELVVQENRRYAKRQLIWFRKEPNLTWIEGPGEANTTIETASAVIDMQLGSLGISQ